MEEANRIKYDITAINQVLAMMDTIASDTKAHSGLQLMSDLIGISNILRNGQIFYDPLAEQEEYMKQFIQNAQSKKDNVQSEESTGEIPMESDEETIVYDGNMAKS